MPIEADHQPDRFDAVIVGGSYAGLSAALQLARARRQVLVVDAGQRRNRYAATSHGFLGQDGKAPGSIVAEARSQLMAYPTVHWREGIAASASRGANGFAIGTGAGETVTAARLVLAMGVVDQLPGVEGLAERWGRSVFHCPYCHGYELDQGRIGVLASSELSMHHALMLPHWGQVTLFLNGAFEPTAEQMAELAARNVSVEAARVRRLVDRATVELVDDRRLEMDGLFTVTRTRVASPLAELLGCAFDEGPLGAYIRTDAGKETSVPGVFACGDAARATGNVATAVGDGALAGAGAHRSILFG
jgi:thioredoxin reductase